MANFFCSTRASGSNPERLASNLPGNGTGERCHRDQRCDLQTVREKGVNRRDGEGGRRSVSRTECVKHSPAIKESISFVGLPGISSLRQSERVS